MSLQPAEQLPNAYHHQFDQVVVDHAATAMWYTSPSIGVSRRPLMRIGAEVAYATSVVRYAAGSHFPAHTHGGGEEIWVLSGVFSDEHGGYPAGSYLRNPVGSSHAPFSVQGCEILVRLWQVLPDDTRQCALTPQMSVWQQIGQGIQRCDLHQYRNLYIYILKIPAHHTVTLAFGQAVEIWINQGKIIENQTIYDEKTWLRFPDQRVITWHAADQEVQLLIYEGWRQPLSHLMDK